MIIKTLIYIPIVVFIGGPLTVLEAIALFGKWTCGAAASWLRTQLDYLHELDDWWI